jgi:hypothetical protein
MAYSSHLHTAMQSVIIAAHAIAPSSAPTKIPLAFDCGPISGLRSSISVFSMRIRMVLVSWSNRLIVNSPSQKTTVHVAA